ncbi:MAG: diadenylate cyclase CdaA [Romboutsia sp.]|nr:diadenylate cyclase CdaA [Romboutsia sp.]
MNNIFNGELLLLKDYFNNFGFKNILDIFIVFIIIMKLLDFLSKTRAIQAVKGIVLIYISQILSEILGLEILNEFLGYATTLLWVSLIFIFNKEFRLLLENLGRFKTNDIIDADESINQIKIISSAIDKLAENKVGSLIVVERDAPLRDYIDTGHQVDALLSEELICTIFENHSRFHDGAVIVKDSRIISAKCLLPLSKNINKKFTYGTRHRAAAGITEISDSISIITSEETGKISISSRGILYTVTNSDELVNKYMELSKENYIKEQVKQFSFKDIINYKNKK